MGLSNHRQFFPESQPAPAPLGSSSDEPPFPASKPWHVCGGGPTLQMELAAERHRRGDFLKSQKIFLPLTQIIADGSLNIPLLRMIKKQNPWGKLATATGAAQITINLSFFYFCVNMQKLGQALGTNSTTQDASVRKACPRCLRIITAWDKVVGTSSDLVLEPPSSLKEPYVAQSLPYFFCLSANSLWCLVPHTAIEQLLYLFFFSATLQGFRDLSS